MELNQNGGWSRNSISRKIGSTKEDSLSRVVLSEVWDVTFNMLDLGPSLAVTKVKARGVCQAMRKVETKKSGKMKTQGGGEPQSGGAECAGGSHLARRGIFPGTHCLDQLHLAWELGRFREEIRFVWQYKFYTRFIDFQEMDKNQKQTKKLANIF